MTVARKGIQQIHNKKLSAVDESTAVRNSYTIVSLGRVRVINKRLGWNTALPSKRSYLPLFSLRARMRTWQLPRRTACVVPVSGSASRGAACHAGGLCLLQRVLHSGAVAGENSSGGSSRHIKHQDDYCSLVLMLFLNRSRTLSPALLLQRRNNPELQNELVANITITLSCQHKLQEGGKKMGEGGKKSPFNAAQGIPWNLEQIPLQTSSMPDCT